MIQKSKSYILAFITMMLLSVPVLAPAAAYAARPCADSVGNGISDGANDAIGPGAGVNCRSTGVGNGSIGRIGHSIVTVFSLVVGAVAVIMIIYGGFRYITSGGDSNRVGAAKSTLIYAIVGLIIVALAQVIVHFVLFQSSEATKPACSSNHSLRPPDCQP